MTKDEHEYVPIKLHGWEYPAECNCPLCDLFKASKVAPSVPTSRILDQYGYPIPEETKAQVSPEDLELCKRFLSKLKDQTLSRSVHRVISDLMGRLP